MSVRKAGLPLFLEVSIFLVLALALLQQINDPDIWFQLSIGREIFKLGAIPAQEFLVYPNLGLPGAFHEWGYGLIFFLVHKVGGFWGMSILNAVLGSLVFWLLLRATGRRPLANPLHLLVLFAVIYWMEFRLVYRVEIVLYLALAAEILLLERFLLSRNWRWLAPIPVIGLLLTQAHPSVIFLVAVLGMYGLQIIWQCRKNRSDAIRYLAWFALCGLATLLLAILNPYGLTQVLLPFSFVGEQRVTRIVTEFLPSLVSPLKWHFLSLLALSIIAVAVNRKRRVVDILLLLVFGLLAYRYVRNIGLFALLMYVPIAQGLTDLACNLRDRLGWASAPARLTQVQWLSWGLIIVLAVWFSASRITLSRWGAGPEPGLFPETAARFIRDTHPPGRIFNQYELGGYLGWALQGDYQVSVDGRHYTANRALALHTAVTYARPGWQTALDRYDVNTIIIKATRSYEAQMIPLVQMLANDPKWLLVGRWDKILLFFRRGSVPSLPEAFYRDKSEVWLQIREDAEAYIEQQPGRAPAYYSLGEALWGLHEYDPAVEAFQHYLKLAPNNRQVMILLKQLEAERAQSHNDSQIH